MTTTWSDHTVASAISRLQSSQETALPERNRTGRCATSRAPRPALLLRRANKAQINPGLYSSLDESWGSGHHLPHNTYCLVRVRFCVVRLFVWFNQELTSAFNRSTTKSVP